MRKFLISAALISAAAMTAPAAAQYGSYNRPGYGHGQGIDRELDQIRQRIDRAARRGMISGSEANRLFRQADQIDRMASRAARNGLSPRERQELQFRIQRLRQQVQFERRDGRWDDRHDRNDRDDRDRRWN